MSILDRYTTPWRLRRDLQEDGLFNYEIWSANGRRITVLDEADFRPDDPDEEDEDMMLGDALTIAQLIIDKVNRLP